VRAGCTGRCELPRYLDLSRSSWSKSQGRARRRSILRIGCSRPGLRRRGDRPCASTVDDDGRSLFAKVLSTWPLRHRQRALPALRPTRRPLLRRPHRSRSRRRRHVVVRFSARSSSPRTKVLTNLPAGRRPPAITVVNRPTPIRPRFGCRRGSSYSLGAAGEFSHRRYRFSMDRVVLVPLMPALVYAPAVAPVRARPARRASGAQDVAAGVASVATPLPSPQAGQGQPNLVGRQPISAETSMALSARPGRASTQHRGRGDEAPSSQRHSDLEVLVGVGGAATNWGRWS